jgi:hypothetical protein
VANLIFKFFLNDENFPIIFTYFSLSEKILRQVAKNCPTPKKKLF